MSEEEKRLAELLERAAEIQSSNDPSLDWSEEPSQERAKPTPHLPSEPLVGYSQWSAMPNDQYRPSGPRREKLETGVYEVGQDQAGVFFQKIRVVTDDLIELDVTTSDRILGSMRKFWASKNEYTKRGIIYKRGILLWGPAGAGKTSVISLLTQELLSSDGLVIVCRSAALTSDAISILRRIEPDRNLIIVIEDIDEIVDHQGEHSLLALLDGENQVENVVMIASTNYPEKLGARIINRPSRFDERILVDMPDATARERYLRHITKNEEMAEGDIQRWVSDTDGFSVAHLRELVVAYFCLQQPYDTVLERLKSMQFQLKALPEFKRPSGPGFLGAQLDNSVPKVSRG